MARKRSAVMNKFMQSHDRCELCGETRNLECHHIIPVVCGGEDCEDNLLCVCRVCHSKLTPHSQLCKIGQRPARVLDVLSRMHLRFYELAEELMLDGDELTGVDWPDVFDRVIEEYRSRECHLGH